VTAPDVVAELAQPRWSRVLVKLSGEAFAGSGGQGIDGEVVTELAREVVEVKQRFDVDGA
jgi:uridylate kinase